MLSGLDKDSNTLHSARESARAFLAIHRQLSIPRDIARLIGRDIYAPIRCWQCDAWQNAAPARVACCVCRNEIDCEGEVTMHLECTSHHHQAVNTIVCNRCTRICYACPEVTRHCMWCVKVCDIDAE